MPFYSRKKKECRLKGGASGVMMHSLIWYDRCFRKHTCLLTRFTKRFTAPFTVNPRTQLDTLYTTQRVLEKLDRARRQTAPPPQRSPR